MPKLKRDEVADLDVKVLDEQEYTEGDFETYEGEIPPANTELTGYVKNLWWCRTAEKEDGTGLDPMIKVLWVAADNDGDNEDYNGLPIWENLVLIPGAKFRWAPFLNAHGITLQAIKTATYVGEDDDERVGGAPIEKIGKFEPGEDSDGAWSRLITKRRFWNDEWRAEAKSWLPWADGDGEAHPAAEAEDEDGTEDGEAIAELPEGITEDADGYLVNEDGEYVNEEGELVDEDGNVLEPEEEEPAEPEPAPARGRRAAKPAAAPASTRTAAKAAPARPAAKAAPAKPAAAATSRRAAKPAAAPATKPAGRGRRAGKDNEPPF